MVRVLIICLFRLHIILLLMKYNNGEDTHIYGKMKKDSLAIHLIKV